MLWVPGQTGYIVRSCLQTVKVLRVLEMTWNLLDWISARLPCQPHSVGHSWTLTCVSCWPLTSCVTVSSSFLSFYVYRCFACISCLAWQWPAEGVRSLGLQLQTAQLTTLVLGSEPVPSGRAAVVRKPPSPLSSPSFLFPSSGQDLPVHRRVACCLVCSLCRLQTRCNLLLPLPSAVITCVHHHTQLLLTIREKN